MSLLREIQADAASSTGDVTVVLRKCKILAARLGSRDFADWVKWEREFMRRGINQHTLEKICRRKPVRADKLAKVLETLGELKSERDAYETNEQ